MNYTSYHQRQPRIPGIVGIALLVLFIGGLITFFTPKEHIQPKTARIPIERAEVANIRDNTVTVYWQTSSPTRGYILYGNSPTDVLQKAVDKRDVSSEQSARRNHVVTLSNLISSTDYYYKIVIDSTEVGQTADIPFQFKTARYLKNPLNLDPIVGKIIEEGGKVSPDAIVLIYIGSAHPLIAQAKSDGSFAISPCCIFNRSTYEPIVPKKEEKVIIEIIDEKGVSKKILSTLDTIDSATSVISLNKDDSSKIKDGVILGATDQNGVLQQAEDVQQVNDIDVVFPKDHALIPGSKPLIKGVGIPGKTVKILLKPSGRIFETLIDASKIWQFQPTFDLSSGEHTLELTTKDAQDQKVVVTRSFTIEKSGESVLGDATPSATLTPIASPTAQLITETPSPTKILPTIVPSIPQTGTSILPFGIASVLLIIIGVGMIFVI